MSLHKILFVTLTATMFINLPVQAAQEGHGGNIVDCTGQEAVVLDYYHATLPTLDGQRPKLIDIQHFSSDQVIDLIKKRISNRGYFLSAFSLALQRIGPINSWLSADLKSVDDSNEPYVLPTNCNRRTAVIRQENVTMFGDPNIIHLLSPAQQGILQIHEAMYVIASDHNQTTSENVRTLVRELLRVDLNQNAVDAAIRGLGVSTTAPATTFEMMNSGVYGNYEDVYQVSVDLNLRLLKMTFVGKPSGRLPDNVQNLEFTFDASSLQGREVSDSGCDYDATIVKNVVFGVTINLKSLEEAPECPLLSLRWTPAKP